MKSAHEIMAQENRWSHRVPRTLHQPLYARLNHVSDSSELHGLFNELDDVLASFPETGTVIQVILKATGLYTAAA